MALNQQYFPDVEEVLNALNKHYVLGIVSGRTKGGMYEPAVDTLRKYFKVAIGFEDTEDHKPHPAPLLLAAERLHVLPTECVYIGDVETDMHAALSAGMQFILYSKGELTGADYIAKDFRDIPLVIKKIINQQ